MGVKEEAAAYKKNKREKSKAAKKDRKKVAVGRKNNEQSVGYVILPKIVQCDEIDLQINVKAGNEDWMLEPGWVAPCTATGKTQRPDADNVTGLSGVLHPPCRPTTAPGTPVSNVRVNSLGGRWFAVFASSKVSRTGEGGVLRHGSDSLGPAPDRGR